MGESEEELKCLLMRKRRVKKLTWTSILKKLRSWHLLPSWQQWQILFMGGLEITVNGDFSHEIKRCLLLVRKVVTNLDSISQSRDITLLTKVCRVNAMVLAVVMYKCESWSIKKAEHQRIDAFKLLHWRRFLRVPWTARRSNQSVLKEINPECSLEGLMLKLNTLATWHKEPASH